MKFTIFFMTLLIVQNLWAQTPISAVRHPDFDVSIYENQVVPNKATDTYYATALGSARLYTGNDLATATSWTPENLTAGFAKIRDTRYLYSNQDSTFPRKIFWMYPTDGCYARVELADSLLAQSGFPVPNNVFAIGNLYVPTTNTTTGYASWWFHVAPIVQVEGKYFVLDPAIDPEKPLELKEWLSKMGKPEDIKVAICGAGTDAPGTSCSYSKPYQPDQGTTSWYLTEEWNQLVKLGKDPKTVLAK
jgi:Glutaminase